MPVARPPLDVAAMLQMVAYIRLRYVQLGYYIKQPSPGASGRK